MYQRKLTFGEAVSRVLTENYANFDGRAARSEYWWFVLFNCIITFACGFIGGLIGSETVSSVLSGIYGLATLIPSLAVGVRRLHDTGRSGWWLLISLIPLVGAIVLIVWLAQESEPAPNQYGSIPNID